MFEGFEVRDVVVGAAGAGALTIRVRVAGAGPPVLLLHGYPQTGAMWHEVAPALAEDRMVVVADLRGYGDSAKPEGDERHERYSKRASAADQVRVMAALGIEEFDVVGHDRGARVAHRMALDHPDAVRRLAVLDVVPTRHVFATADAALGLAYYHWFFLAQPRPLPERMIGADPSAYLRWCLDSWSAPTSRFAEEALGEYERCFPSSVHASCEDYRAGATIDLEHDEVDAVAGRRVRCPVLVLWGDAGFVERRYDVLRVWREYADDVRGRSLECGHFLPEEQPAATVAALRDFLRRP